MWRISKETRVQLHWEPNSWALCHWSSFHPHCLLAFPSQAATHTWNLGFLIQWQMEKSTHVQCFKFCRVRKQTSDASVKLVQLPETLPNTILDKGPSLLCSPCQAHSKNCTRITNKMQRNVRLLCQKCQENYYRTVYIFTTEQVSISISNLQVLQVLQVPTWNVSLGVLFLKCQIDGWIITL